MSLIEPETKRPTLVLIFVLLAGIVAASVYAWRGQEVVSTPIAGLSPADPLQVGPIAIAPGARLIIATPELHARIDTAGAARVMRHDPDRLPGEDPLEVAVELGAAGWNELLTDLGRLKAGWTTRLVGESAQNEAFETETDDPARIILVEEEMTDGTIRILMRLRPNDPEYEEIRRIIAPLRIRQ